MRAQREKNKAAQKAWRSRRRQELDDLRTSSLESDNRARQLELENVALREKNRSLEAQLELVKNMLGHRFPPSPSPSSVEEPTPPRSVSTPPFSSFSDPVKELVRALMPPVSEALSSSSGTEANVTNPDQFETPESNAGMWLESPILHQSKENAQRVASSSDSWLLCDPSDQHQQPHNSLSQMQSSVPPHRLAPPTSMLDFTTERTEQSIFDLSHDSVEESDPMLPAFEVQTPDPDLDMLSNVDGNHRDWLRQVRD
ncbi:hypothetical protein HDU93_009399 [Gonapodya sp. JEL0774]|nr:hypothetical protein HDU93_009399 [Gonapodya sp. JEL0774]